MKNKEQVTIITVTKNDSIGLKRTIKSILDQTHQNWECVVVLPEGDPSVGILDETALRDKRFRIKIQDSVGIYSAMNEALGVRKYNKVWFMNGGDTFFSSKSLVLALDIMVKEKASIVLGGHAFINNSGFQTRHASDCVLTFNKFLFNRRNGCHQSMLFDLELFQNLRFDNKYQIAADYKFVLEILNVSNGYRIKQILSTIDLNGISNSQIPLTLREKQEIRKELNSTNDFIVKVGSMWNFLILFKLSLKKIVVKL